LPKGSSCVRVAGRFPLPDLPGAALLYRSGEEPALTDGGLTARRAEIEAAAARLLKREIRVVWGEADPESGEARGAILPVEASGG
jgi:hypothetical protein